jgi:hypothetical protein
MTTVKLGLATRSATTLSISTTIRALVYHGPGKCAWEDKPDPAIWDAGGAIARITTLSWGSKAWRLLALYFPFPEILPLQG